MAVRNKMQGSGGLIAAVVLLLVAGLIAWRYFSQETIADRANTRVYICAETGKSFDHKITPGDPIPVESPYTHRATGFPAEPCYWKKVVDASGNVTYKARGKPFWVLLNQYKGDKSQTICPDCGKPVFPHNGTKQLPSKEDRKKALEEEERSGKG